MPVHIHKGRALRPYRYPVKDEKKKLEVSSLILSGRLVLLVMRLCGIFKLAAREGTSNGANNVMATQLVSGRPASSSATKSAHQASVTFSLCVGISGAVLLASLLAVLSLRILIGSIGSLLGILIGGCLAWILTLLLAVLTLLLAILSFLAVLEAAVFRRSVSSLAVILLLVVATLAVLALLLLPALAVAALAVTALLVASLLLAVLAMLTLTLAVLALLAVALVVLIVGAGHCEGVDL